MVLKEVKAVLFLLFVVASAGLLMRSWNWAIDLGIDFYNLRQAHSHLAFLGWIFPAFIILFNKIFVDDGDQPIDKFLFWIFILINALMFGAFIQFGYTGPSIILLSVHTALAFTYAWRFLGRLSDKVKGGTRLLLVSSIMAMCISFLGPLAIPVVKNTGGGPDQMKLAIHFYLHFQYNAFFVLGVLALMAKKSDATDLKAPTTLTVLGMCGTYFLTVSWGLESELLKAIGAAAANIQFVGLIWLLFRLKPFSRAQERSDFKVLLTVVIGSLVLKSALQVGAYWFPQLSMEGGLHFWVIAYLHLIFLGVVTPYLVLEFIANRLLGFSIITRIGLGLLIIGVIGTEVILGVQGLQTFSAASSIQWMPIVLQVVSAVLWLAAGILFVSSFQTGKK